MTEDTRPEIIAENLSCMSSEKGDLPKAKRESVYLCLRSRTDFTKGKAMFRSNKMAKDEQLTEELSFPSLPTPK